MNKYYVPIMERDEHHMFVNVAVIEIYAKDEVTAYRVTGNMYPHMELDWPSEAFPV